MKKIYSILAISVHGIYLIGRITKSFNTKGCCWLNQRAFSPSLTPPPTMVLKYGKLALGVCLSMAHTSMPNRSLQFRVKAPLSCVNHFPLSKLQVPTFAAVCTFRESWYLPPAAWSKSLRGEAAAFSLAVKFLGFSPLCMFWVSHLWSADFKNIPLAFFFFSVAISKAKKIIKSYILWLETFFP